MKSDLGRGERATLDMRLRLADLRRRDVDVIEVLWARTAEAERGDGYTYEYADEALTPQRQAVAV